MKYSIKWLIENNEGKEYLFFWGHQPSKDGSVTKSCLSQWWICDFTYENVNYKCTEQWMMSQKALLFDDKEVFEEILLTDDPSLMKKLGRKIRNFNESLWNKKKYDIVLFGNYLKFGQNKTLKEFLLNTDNLILVEASPYDNIWGIGMKSDDKNINNPNLWKGENLLGFALTEVKEILKNNKTVIKTNNEITVEN